MKRLLILAVLVFPIFGLSTHAYSPKMDDTIIISINSATLLSEANFEGSYVYKTDDSPLQHVERNTPFEIRCQSDIAYGIFRSKGWQDLTVKMITSKDGKQTESVIGSGKVVVVGKFREIFVTAFE